MKTGDIEEKHVSKALVVSSWRTAKEVVDRLEAPGAALRKIAVILRVMETRGEVESQFRHTGFRGRPPKEYKLKRG